MTTPPTPADPMAEVEERARAAFEYLHQRDSRDPSQAHDYGMFRKGFLAANEEARTLLAAQPAATTGCTFQCVAIAPCPKGECAYAKLASRGPAAQEGERNQCDGCARGLPLVNGLHRGGGSWDVQACTADRYGVAAGGDAQGGLDGESGSDWIAVGGGLYRKRGEAAAQPPAPAGEQADLSDEQVQDMVADATIKANLPPAWCIQHAGKLAVFAAALLAHAAARAAVPPGFKLVPVEATPEMLAPFVRPLNLPAAYRAMLDAAPSPEQGGEG